MAVTALVAFFSKVCWRKCGEVWLFCWTSRDRDALVATIASDALIALANVTSEAYLYRFKDRLRTMGP